MAEKVPPALKSVQPYLVLAKQFMKRDPIVAYFANMYAVQEGISLGKSDPAAKAYLLNVMDQLQEMKKALKDEEALGNELVAQAHIEEVALRLFETADNEDRAAHFHKNMIKVFYTSSHIFAILKQFGELSEEIESKMKYAKWKAVEIDRCLKSGVAPTPGPPGGEELGEEEVIRPAPAIGFSVTPPAPSGITLPPGAQPVLPPISKPVPKPRQSLPQDPGPEQPPSSYQPPVAASGMELGPAEIARAQKLCKHASSALDYEDVQGAIELLCKATRLLQTGRED